MDLPTDIELVLLALIGAEMVVLHVLRGRSETRRQRRIEQRIEHESRRVIDSMRPRGAQPPPPPPPFDNPLVDFPPIPGSARRELGALEAGLKTLCKSCGHPNSRHVGDVYLEAAGVKGGVRCLDCGCQRVRE